MAKVINLVTVGAPTTPTSTPSAGGALVEGTTYYYRVIALYRYLSKLNIIGSPSPEVSFTATASDRSTTISWSSVTNATHYIVQRTTTSGSYPVGGQNSLQLSSSGSSYNFATTQSSVFDDGGSTSNVIFTAYNLDHDHEYPAIDVSATGGETITMQDIYLADVAGGWGVCSKLVTSNWANYNSSTVLTDQVPYRILGSMYVHECTFQLRGMLYMEGGTFYSDNSNAKSPTLLMGNSGYSYFPYIFTFCPYSLYATSDNSTWNAGYLPYGECVVGSTSSRVYGLIRRNLMTYSSVYPVSSNRWDDGFGTPLNTSGAVYQNCNLGLRGGNGTPTYVADYSGTIFESGRPYANITGSNYIYTQWSMAWRHGGVMTNFSVLNPTSDDGLWGTTYGWLHINPTYQSQGQSNNEPYWALTLDYRGLVGLSTLVIGYTIEVLVVDTEGNPISGANVVIEDSNGNVDLWQETDAYSVILQNNTDTVTTVTTVNPNELEVGDTVKLMNYTEIMGVTAKPTATTVSFSRGLQGTDLRAKNFTFTYSYGENKIWKQLSSLTTDANGIVAPENPLINRELIINSNSSTWGKKDYESNHVSNNYLVRNYKTPHKITVSKSGYQTKTVYLDVSEETKQVITLEKAVKYIMPDGKKMYWNLKPEDSQNKFEFNA